MSLATPSPARRVAAAVAVVVFIAAVAWVVGSRVETASQAAARAQPPPATPVTVEVERRVLTHDLVFRGRVVPMATVSVPVPSLGDGIDPVVTAVPLGVGDQIREGELVISVSDRPIFALHGPIPSYRDLRPGDRGPDVARLQQALARLGHAVVPDGVFGSATQGAVAALYERAGYEPVVYEPDGPGALEQARLQVTASRRAAAEARASGDPALVAEASNAVAQAEAELVRRQATTGVMLPRDETIYVPVFPATVTALAGGVGQRPDQALLTLAAGELRVEARVSTADGGRVREGLTVQVHSDLDGTQVDGTITSVGPPTADDQLGTARPLTISPNSPLDPAFLGVDVRVTATIGTTGGPALVVPLSAISASPDGSARVTRLSPNGEQVPVPVRVGLSAAGYATVEPTSGVLGEGDTVVIG